MEVNANIDIHELVDDAMEKKDRRINIYISNYGTSVYIEPIRDEDEPHWIDITPEPDPEKDNFFFHSILYRCSNCGSTTKFSSPYCPVCGEQMHGVRKEKKHGKVKS